MNIAELNRQACLLSQGGRVPFNVFDLNLAVEALALTSDGAVAVVKSSEGQVFNLSGLHGSKLEQVWIAVSSVKS